MVRLGLGVMSDTLMEELERSIVRSRQAKTLQFFFLVLADDGEPAHLHLRLCHHAFGHGYDALGQCRAQAGGVQRVVVLYHHAPVFYLDIDLEHRDVQAEQFLTDGAAADSVP